MKLCFMDTNGKETVTDVHGSTKGTGCTVNCVYHISLPHKAGLAKLKKGGVASLLNYRVSLYERDYFTIKNIWVLFG